MEATYSFLYPSSYPAASLEALGRQCQRQSEAFKCIREQTKGSPSLIRRGLLAYVQSRQRYHRRLCANPQGQAAREFVAAMQCVMEKRLASFKAADEYLLRQFTLILRKNYNDSAPELKQICCTFWNFQRVSTTDPLGTARASQPLTANWQHPTTRRGPPTAWARSAPATAS